MDEFRRSYIDTYRHAHAGGNWIFKCPFLIQRRFVERGLGGAIQGTDATYIARCHFLFDSTEDFMAAFMPHAEALQDDIPNYTDIGPTIQLSEALICLRAPRLRFVYLQFIGLPKPIFTSNTEETKKFWTFKMIWRIADRCVTEPIAHRSQFFNFSVQLIRLS